MTRLDSTHADEPDGFVTPQDRTHVKSEPGGVINTRKDGPTGGWGTAARWFLLALLVILLAWGYLWISG